MHLHKPISFEQSHLVANLKRARATLFASEQENWLKQANLRLPGQRYANSGIA